MTIQSLQLRFPHLPSGGRVITSPLYLSKLLGESNEATPIEALRTLQRGVTHSSDNTHNNFNSTDRSGINSPQRVVLLRALQWSVFRIESSQWIGKWPRLRKGSQSWHNLASWQSPATGSEITLPGKGGHYFNTRQSLPVLGICQLVFLEGLGAISKRRGSLKC